MLAIQVNLLIAVAIAAGPVLVALLWYNGRVKALRRALANDDPSEESKRHAAELKRRVTRDAWLVFAGMLAYWLLLSAIFP
jgi:hypothetical protein